MINTKPAIGLSSILGTLLAVAGALGTAYSAVKDNDFATAVSAGAAALALVATISSRTAQAVAMIRKGVTIAGPYIDAAQSVIALPSIQTSSAATAAPPATFHITNSYSTPREPADAPAHAATAGDGTLSGDPRPQSERPAPQDPTTPTP